jgi:hypothetical protein
MKILKVIKAWFLGDRTKGFLDYESFLGWESLREPPLKKEEECLQRRPF